MDSKQLRTAIALTGLSKGAFGESLEVGSRMLRRMISGEIPVPKSIEYACYWLLREVDWTAIDEEFPPCHEHLLFGRWRDATGGEQIWQIGHGYMNNNHECILYGNVRTWTPRYWRYPPQPPVKV